MEKHKWIRLILLALFLGLRSTSVAQAESIEVTTTEDTLDADANCLSISYDELPGEDRVTSLREAICAANNNGVPDTITFNLTCDPYCVIEPEPALPIIIDDHTTIDGGGTPATESTPATFEIVLDGSEVNNHNGLTILSADNVIKGLIIHEFGVNGIAIAGQYATGNVITGNCLGRSDQITMENGNVGSGLSITLGASDNTIGGNTPAERNIISGNGLDGVTIHGPNSTGNVVIGNFIGTDGTGIREVFNQAHGVRIYGEAHNNTIGTAYSGEGNLISANIGNGVRISNASINNVVGNYIGTDISGTQDIGNDKTGVVLELGASENFIKANLISANDGAGVSVIDEESTGNTIARNFIGTDASGTLPLGNNSYGIIIASADNVIGGEVPSDGNLISDNFTGIFLDLLIAEGNLISYNYIGTDVHGNPTLGNHSDGIYYGGTRERFIHYSNTINPSTKTHQPATVPVPAAYTTLIESNLIAGNERYGIFIGGDAELHFITENSIFANETGIFLAPAVNGGIAPPVINATNEGSVIIQGTARPGTTIEIFENQENDPQGEFFIGDTIVDAFGVFSLTIDGFRFPYLTATATDEDLGTSSFSEVFEATYLGTQNVYLPVIEQP
jgi:hypothetical protein